MGDRARRFFPRKLVKAIETHSFNQQKVELTNWRRAEKREIASEKEETENKN